MLTTQFVQYPNLILLLNALEKIGSLKKFHKEYCKRNLYEIYSLPLYNSLKHFVSLAHGNLQAYCNRELFQTSNTKGYPSNQFELLTTRTEYLHDSSKCQRREEMEFADCDWVSDVSTMFRLAEDVFNTVLPHPGQEVQKRLLKYVRTEV